MKQRNKQQKRMPSGDDHFKFPKKIDISYKNMKLGTIKIDFEEDKDAWSTFEKRIFSGYLLATLNTLPIYLKKDITIMKMYKPIIRISPEMKRKLVAISVMCNLLIPVILFSYLIGLMYGLYP